MIVITSVLTGKAFFSGRLEESLMPVSINEKNNAWLQWVELLFSSETTQACMC